MTVLASGGSYVTPEMFAIDWIRETGGNFYTAGGMANTDWPGFGVPLHAVADGTVVATTDGLPDISPLTNNPDLRTPEDYAGNNVMVRVAPHRYAVFDHMVTGSVRVRPGQRVRTGQVLGLLGNSGNTDGPHLHFGIQTRPDSLSASVPFEINRFRGRGERRTAAGPGRRGAQRQAAPGAAGAAAHRHRREAHARPPASVGARHTGPVAVES
jgi:murein DD-endopeptidase MepM/ murein hydrolase activator NlpD